MEKEFGSRKSHEKQREVRHAAVMGSLFKWKVQ